MMILTFISVLLAAPMPTPLYHYGDIVKIDANYVYTPMQYFHQCPGLKRGKVIGLKYSFRKVPGNLMKEYFYEVKLDKGVDTRCTIYVREAEVLK